LTTTGLSVSQKCQRRLFERGEEVLLGLRENQISEVKMESGKADCVFSIAYLFKKVHNYAIFILEQCIFVSIRGQSLTNLFK